MDPNRRHRLAVISITVLFLALVRTLSEIFRLKYVRGGVISYGAAEPYIIGALAAALGCWLAVTFYFFKRETAVVITAVATIGVLLAIKFALLGW
jgi:hypothetical protein